MNNPELIDPKTNQVVGYLNGYLIEQQNIIDVETLKKAHIVRHHIFEKMKQTNYSPTLKNLAKRAERVEYIIQKLWGFPQDRNYHRWWNLPGCTCPKLDNEDRWGTPYRIYVEYCPIHREVSV